MCLAEKFVLLPQEAALELYTQFNCCVVFLGAELKEKYYKGKWPA